MTALRNIDCIARITYRELMRGKALYLVIFFSIIIVSVSALFGSVTIGDQVSVIKDFGLFSISIFSLAFAVIAGASLLHKELTKKTIYNTLTKPVRRWEFLWGKFFGMVLTVGFLIALMGIGLTIFVFLFSREIDYLILLSLPYIFLEMMIICATTIFFSSIVVTPVLSGLFTAGVFLAGRSVDYLNYFIDQEGTTGMPRTILKAVHAGLPHLSKLNIVNDVVAKNLEAFSLERIGWALSYSCCYSAILLVIGSLLFMRRDFN